MGPIEAGRFSAPPASHRPPHCCRAGPRLPRRGDGRRPSCWASPRARPCRPSSSSRTPDSRASSCQSQPPRPRRRPRARDRTGLVIHGVSGSRHWQDTLSDPDPRVVDRGIAAIRQELEDCRAYGGTTVLVVPAVVNRQVGYRAAYERSQANIRKLIPDAEKHGIKIAIEEVWNRFLLSPLEFARYIDEFQSPWVGAYFDVGNVVEYGYPEEWIRELGRRILKIHIKEYAKSKRFSYKLGEGNEIDWAPSAMPCARRLRRLDHRRGPLRHPR